MNEAKYVTVINVDNENSTKPPVQHCHPQHRWVIFASD